MNEENSESTDRQHTGLEYFIKEMTLSCFSCSLNVSRQDKTVKERIFYSIKLNSVTVDILMLLRRVRTRRVGGTE